MSVASMVYRCSTLAELSLAFEKREQAGGVGRVALVCKTCFTEPAIAEKKVAVGNNIYCRSHAFGVEKKQKPSLTDAEFSRKLVRCVKPGLHEFYIYNETVDAY